MAQAIICEQCGAAAKLSDAATWVRLTLQARGELHIDRYIGDGASKIAEADLCSRRCAEKWTEAKLSDVLPFRTARGY